MGTTNKIDGPMGQQSDERFATGHFTRRKRTGSTEGGYRAWSEHWNDTRDQLKNAHGELTEADLRYVEGKEEELVARLSRRLKCTPERTRELLCAAAEQGARSVEQNDGPVSAPDAPDGPGPDGPHPDSATP